MENGMEEAVEPEHGLSPGALGLLALLSIGGLLFVGWQASIVGNYISGPYEISGPYAACCSVEPWGSSQAGFRQGTGLTTTEVCKASELPQRCCVRSTRDRYSSPVRLLHAQVGTCSSPEMSYPLGDSASYSTCCTVETYRSAPTGYIQGESETTTEHCVSPESPKECCARAASSRTQFSVRVLGARAGDCNPPQVSYPAPVNGYPACCSYSTWENSPVGYTQGNAETTDIYCDPIETLSQCCARSALQVSSKPIKLLGFKLGGCAPPEVSYPIWVH